MAWGKRVQVQMDMTGHVGAVEEGMLVEGMRGVELNTAA